MAINTKGKGKEQMNSVEIEESTEFNELEEELDADFEDSDEEEVEESDTNW